MWIFLNKTKNKIISNSFSTDSCLVRAKNPTYLPNRCSTSPSPSLLQPQCSPWRGSSTTRESLRTRTFACAVLSGTLFSQTSYDLPLSAFRCELNCRLIFEALHDLTPPLTAYPIFLILLHFPPSHLSSSDMLYIYLLFLSSVSHIRMQASWGQRPCSIHWCVHSASNSAQHTVGTQ